MAGCSSSHQLHFISQYAIECVISIILSLSTSLSTMITNHPMDTIHPMIMDFGNLIHSYKKWIQMIAMNDFGMPNAYGCKLQLPDEKRQIQ